MKMNKNTIIIIVALGVLALAGVWLFQSNKEPTPAPLDEATELQPTDSAQMIVNDVDALDVGEIDQEFQDIDADLQTL